MLFLVRIAQGLVHMGKGLFTLNPYHTDNQLASGDSPSSSHHRICSADLILVVVYMISKWLNSESAADALRNADANA